MDERCSCNRPLWYCDSDNPDIPVCAECSRKKELCWCPYMSEDEHQEFLKYINKLERG